MLGPVVVLCEEAENNFYITDQKATLLLLLPAAAPLGEITSILDFTGGVGKNLKKYYSMGHISRCCCGYHATL